MSKKILVVDDQEIVRDFFKDVAECLGEEVETAEDGDVAIDICRNRHFDITFVDMRMPHMNGLDTCKAILSLDPHARVVVMTGYTEEQMIDEALHSGAIAKIYKPFDIDMVVRLIRGSRNKDEGQQSADGDGETAGDDGGVQESKP
ncbi:MAG: response regulator [bacterium]|jgi:DNA-binding NtrC family response regulator